MCIRDSINAEYGDTHTQQMSMLPRWLLVGSYTLKEGHVGSASCPHPHGITVFRREDVADGFGHLVQHSQLEEGPPNLSYLCASKDGGFVYAVSETGGPNEEGNLLCAFQFEEGHLTLLNSVETMGASACHLSLSPCGEVLTVANYSGGSVCAVKVQEDGSLGAMSCFRQHEGSGPNPERQADGAHAHMAQMDAEGRHVLVPDLGLDKVLVYRLDREGGQLERVSEFNATPGAGSSLLTSATVTVSGQVLGICQFPLTAKWYTF
eukprot:TRINITY_DN24467_c0_g1_i2.p1 TRINITY_DN24467_c0_g1~~TRINITY_DN24467_c0_g1_i2.p1  ORF type:complete len:264 (-),score=41.72 TRINITY_DN24467_c0_g1_i2:877-1668(-)